MSKNKIIEIKVGSTHSLAITKKGDMYTWGEGSKCRLGLGFMHETQSTPDQLTPY
jgi:alpha-tubulin suppressor-like RCC1 family protein